MNELTEAIANGAHAGLIRLCGILAGKALLDRAELEVIRHLALEVAFDERQKQPDLTGQQREMMDQARAMLDRNWGKAVEQAHR